MCVLVLCGDNRCCLIFSSIKWQVTFPASVYPSKWSRMREKCHGHCAHWLSSFRLQRAFGCFCLRSLVTRCTWCMRKCGLLPNRFETESGTVREPTYIYGNVSNRCFSFTQFVLAKHKQVNGARFACTSNVAGCEKKPYRTAPLIYFYYHSLVLERYIRK